MAFIAIAGGLIHAVGFWDPLGYLYASHYASHLTPNLQLFAIHSVCPTKFGLTVSFLGLFVDQYQYLAWTEPVTPFFDLVLVHRCWAKNTAR